MAFGALVVLAACGQGASTIVVPTTPSTSAPVSTLEPTTSSTSLAPAATAATPTTVALGPWVPVTGNLAGQPSTCGTLSLVSARPDKDELIAGLSAQGLWANQSGSTWAPIGKGAGSAPITNRSTSIVYDPEHPGTFWESGIYGNGSGVYKTTDGGATFRALGAVPGSDGVSVDFTDPARKTLLAGSHERHLVYRSSNGGASWTDVSASLPQAAGNLAQPYVVNATTFLLGSNNGTASGVFRSTDAGRTWTQTYQGSGVTGQPLVSATEPGALFWVTQPTGAVIKSTDGGATWTKVSPDGAVSPNAPFLVELADGRLVGVGSSTLVISANRGSTWQVFGPELPLAGNGVVYSPARKAFYVWHAVCDTKTSDPLRPDTVLRLDYDASATH